MSQDAIVLAFLERLLNDQRRGAILPLAAYQRRYPGFEDVLAESYVEVLAGAPAPIARRVHQGSDSSEERIGPYRVREELGRGGQGIVYRAVDERVERSVALKVLTALGPGSSNARQRFQREGSVAARLAHPNIRTVFEADIEDGVPYIAMQYVDGASLAQRIAETRELPPSHHPPWVQLDARAELASLLLVFEKIARALHHSHEAGVLHRDVKPGNVLLTSSGEPVLSDFGLACVAAADQPALTFTGDVLGTPAYMSPEQLDPGDEQIDRRTDVYSLGVSLYECLTLTPPFRAPTRGALIQLVLTHEPVHPRKLNSHVPRELAVVVATAMAKDRDHRYQTAEAMADDLRHVRLHEPIEARPPGPLLRLLRWSQRNPALAGALSITGLLLAGIAGVYASKNEEVRARNVELSAAIDQVSAEVARTMAEKQRVTRLKDRRTLRLLLERADQLYPPVPEQIGPMTAWLADASALLAALPLHRAALSTLDGPATGPSAGEEAWIRELLVELIGELEALSAPGGRIADVRARVERARAIAPATLEASAALWRAAAERVRASERYRGLELVPQLGLIPLGPDPGSGWEEFLHWLTQDPEHAPPTRDADGRLPATDGWAGIVLVLLPGGTFVQGATTDPAGPNFDHAAKGRDGPPHAVTLDPFFLAKYELTRGQFTRLSGRPDPSHFNDFTAWRIKGAEFARYPVESVSWLTCRSELGRADLVLPTESQWEYACRAGTDTIWSFGGRGDAFVAYANLADESYAANWGGSLAYERGLDDGHGVVAPVGSFLPNAFGFFDMHGNVEEWCEDRHGPYSGGHARGTGLLLETGDIEGRILRGGPFDANRWGVRSAARGWLLEGRARTPVGVRASRRLSP